MSGGAGACLGAAAIAAKSPSRGRVSSLDARSNFGSANLRGPRAGLRVACAVIMATKGLASARSPKLGGASGERYGRESAKAKLAAQAIATALKPDSRTV